MVAAPGSEYSFAVCLSHDVDRIYRTYQCLWNAFEDRKPRELLGVFDSRNPYWTFERTMEIEAGLGVRSSFNVLDELSLKERPPTDWFSLSGWKLFAGRYDIEDPDVAATLRVLDEFGWELGLHGSYTSSRSPDRFVTEKNHVETVADTELIGNRQHYWRLKTPDTWRHLRSAGIRYDTSLGSSTAVDFQHGYELLRPFEDDFVVFPWSLMDGAVMAESETASDALSTISDVFEAARTNRSVVVLNWHAGDAFSDRDNPGWAAVYESAVEQAIEMGAWVGPPGEFYRAIPQPDGTVDDALDELASTVETPAGETFPRPSGP